MSSCYDIIANDFSKTMTKTVEKQNEKIKERDIKTNSKSNNQNGSPFSVGDIGMLAVHSNY